MRVKIYGIKNCDTMKKAFAWLDKNGVEYEFHDYKKAGVPPGKLKAWAKQAGWEALANTRGPTWRKIPEAQREKLTEAHARAARSAFERDPPADRRGGRQAHGRFRSGRVRAGAQPSLFFVTALAMMRALRSKVQ